MVISMEFLSSSRRRSSSRNVPQRVMSEEKRLSWQATGLASKRFFGQNLQKRMGKQNRRLTRKNCVDWWWDTWRLASWDWEACTSRHACWSAHWKRKQTNIWCISIIILKNTKHHIFLIVWFQKISIPSPRKTLWFAPPPHPPGFSFPGGLWRPPLPPGISRIFKRGLHLSSFGNSK